MLAKWSILRTARVSRRPVCHGFHCRARPSARRCVSTSSTASCAGGNGGTTPSTLVATNMAPLSGLIDEMDKIAPRFELEDGNIEILEGPTSFYEALKMKILQAKRRIYLSTLYIGKTEHELISTIRTGLRENPDLVVSFLTDALRGTRETPEPTTASLLVPLISEFGPERVQIRMFHTPNLTGLKKRLIPKRINEGWGLQHMKLYGIDDEIILSGANLSQDYFTNRLDRYHVFHSKRLTEYYERIHSAVSSISFDVQPDSDSQQGYSMTWPETNLGPNPLNDSRDYISHAATLISPLINPLSKPSSQSLNKSSSLTSESQTYVYPIFQLTPILTPTYLDQDSKATFPAAQCSTELPAMVTLLTHLRRPPFSPARLTFTAGYFNPSATLIDLLLCAAAVNTTKPAEKPAIYAQLDVIAASPYANGFFGSKGISGMLPPAYTLLCRRFLEEAQRRGLDGHAESNSGVRLREWRRGTVGKEGGWTYHAKGIWVTLPQSAGPGLWNTTANDGEGSQHGNKTISTAEDEILPKEEPGPCITLIGSSNYTQRSYTLDLEANALVLTRDKELQKRLREEEEWLGRDANEVRLEDYQRTERRVSLRVRLAMWITKLVGGAL